MQATISVFAVTDYLFTEYMFLVSRYAKLNSAAATRIKTLILYCTEITNESVCLLNLNLKRSVVAKRQCTRIRDARKYTENRDLA